jgi:hypothetical protein
MHRMFTRAPGPAWVKGCVCAEPQNGHGMRGEGAGPSVGDEPAPSDPPVSLSFATPCLLQWNAPIIT